MCKTTQMSRISPFSYRCMLVKKMQIRVLTWTSAIMEALDNFQVRNQDSECFEALMVPFLFLFIVTNICDKYRVWMFWSINGSLHIPVCEAFQFSHSSFPICSLFWSCKMNLEDSKYLDCFALLKDALNMIEFNSTIQKHYKTSQDLYYYVLFNKFK